MPAGRDGGTEPTRAAGSAGQPRRRRRAAGRAGARAADTWRVGRARRSQGWRCRERGRTRCSGTTAVASAGESEPRPGWETRGGGWRRVCGRRCAASGPRLAGVRGQGAAASEASLLGLRKSHTRRRSAARARPAARSLYLLGLVSSPGGGWVSTAFRERSAWTFKWDTAVCAPRALVGCRAASPAWARVCSGR